MANVSFQNFAPGFIARFIESHAVMLQGNAGLKPKEGEYTSRPWEWPINLRVSKQGCLISEIIWLVIKGGLISESFFTLAQISKQMCQITLITTWIVFRRVIWQNCFGDFNLFDPKCKTF